MAPSPSRADPDLSPEAPSAPLGEDSKRKPSRLRRRLKVVGKWAAVIVVLDILAWIIGITLTVDYLTTQ